MVKKRHPPRVPVLASVLEPGVQVGAATAVQAFRYEADMHTAAILMAPWVL